MIKGKERNLVFEFAGNKPYSDQEEWNTEITKIYQERAVCMYVHSCNVFM
jgi:hypothetical protein